MMLQFVRLRLLQGLAFFSLLVALRLFFVSPDIERFLKENVSGQHMPDAFNGLNRSLPILLMFFALTLLLALWIELKRQYVLLVTLLFGPSSCFVGWCLTENFDDPNWFHLIALITMGMFVSCVVTAVLLVATKNVSEQSI